MSLKALLDLSAKRGAKQGISEERLKKSLPELRKAIAFIGNILIFLLMILKDQIVILIFILTKEFFLE